jgi:diguanylate cyclase (GGDEF)-like protein
LVTSTQPHAYTGPERRDLEVRAQRNVLAQWLDLHPGTLGQVPAPALGALDLSLQAGKVAEKRIRDLRSRSTRLEEQVRELEAQALVDSLTGVASRRAMEMRINHECAVMRRSGQAFAVFMLDADNLKEVNDTYGHAAGDDFLRAMGAQLRRSVRDMDLVARLGGDEFVVVCPATVAATAAELEARLAIELSADIAVAGGAIIRMSVSIGWVIAGPRCGSAELLQEADAAMYRVKAGRGREHQPA